jgi:phosphoribosylformylglycinamidine synthase
MLDKKMFIKAKKGLSELRISQLQDKVSSVLPGAKIASQTNLFYVQFYEPSQKHPDELKLKEVLGAAEEKQDEYLDILTKFSREQKFTTLSILPRLGTVSAWQTKSLEIIHQSGIFSVEKIEQIKLFILSFNDKALTPEQVKLITPILHDPMTESVLTANRDFHAIFSSKKPGQFQTLDLSNPSKNILENYNQEKGLGLTPIEINYLYEQYKKLNREATDVELMMFAQINSEHCRHKIFKSKWEINQQKQSVTLFDWIKQTMQHKPNHVKIAYKDNAAVAFDFTSDERLYHSVLKVETHNHPTAISPFPGAATGVGGEIRDEAATGRGAIPKMGLTGFSVSDLHIPVLPQSYEDKRTQSKPPHMASALEIMLEAPIGGARFGNEFGRPAVCGYFRSYSFSQEEQKSIGFHKPIMIAGGLGNIQQKNVHKIAFPAGTPIIVLGGPAMEIGLGGGASSSQALGQQAASLDYASVQRDNAEMERRAQEVISACSFLPSNPILSVHDVGAGGLCNAVPELVHDAGLGITVQLREIPTADPGLSPLGIWCNEAQERFVLAIDNKQLIDFEKIAEQENCPYAIIGYATEEKHLKIWDSLHQNYPVDLPMQMLLGDLPIPEIVVSKFENKLAEKPDNKLFKKPEDEDLDLLLTQILAVPTVGDKSFLITIGDRTVGGKIARDQLVGPYQIPVSDCAVSLIDDEQYIGEAMSMGERPVLALMDSAAASRMSMAEAILNILAADITDHQQITFSANWMAAAKIPQEAIRLYDAVKAASLFCQALGMSIPVGKDSLSMVTKWKDNQGEENQVVSPVTLITTAFAPVTDVRNTLTPELKTDVASVLIYIDLAEGQMRLGGSIYDQTQRQLSTNCPDLVDISKFKQFILALKALKREKLLLAYHDKSDGGIWATLCEMAFATQCSLVIESKTQKITPAWLLNEELGIVVQLEKNKLESFKEIMQAHNLADTAHVIGKIEINNSNVDNKITIPALNYEKKLVDLQMAWSSTSMAMTALRDNPKCAAQLKQNLQDQNLPKLFIKNIPDQTLHQSKGPKPKVAILREQGVNGAREMAAAFNRAGFEAQIIQMNALLAGDANLEKFVGLAACGGFSYGDVLGAGTGWAHKILFNPILLKMFKTFFERPDTFTLGICNGCQMLSQLKNIIPGAKNWPNFQQNVSEQFEARLVMVKVVDSPSIFLQNMTDFTLPIVVSHGEGRVEKIAPGAQELVTLRYIDNTESMTERYPFNPNGSVEGATGFSSEDGRALIMMPHPERVFRKTQFSWYPSSEEDDSPWMQLFYNARRWIKN